MSTSATEHHGDDPRTDHYNKLQYSGDEFDDYEAPDDAASEHEHRPEYSEDGGEELDNYSKAGESVNIHADSSISWKP